MEWCVPDDSIRVMVAPKLLNLLLVNSDSDDPREAVSEWRVGGMTDSGYPDGVCECGHHGLRYLYDLHNVVTGAVIQPVGSECILDFDSPDMTNVHIQGLRDITRLLNVPVGMRTFRYLKDNGLLKRSFIRYLYDEMDVFSSSEFALLEDYFNNYRRGFSCEDETRVSSAINHLFDFVEDFVG